MASLPLVLKFAVYTNTRQASTRVVLKTNALPCPLHSNRSSTSSVLPPAPSRIPGRDRRAADQLANIHQHHVFASAMDRIKSTSTARQVQAACGYDGEAAFKWERFNVRVYAVVVRHDLSIETSHRLSPKTPTTSSSDSAARDRHGRTLLRTSEATSTARCSNVSLTTDWATCTTTCSTGKRDDSCPTNGRSQYRRRVLARGHLQNNSQSIKCSAPMVAI